MRTVTSADRLALETYRTLAPVIRAFVGSSRGAIALFQPSELEQWIRWESAPFFDERRLHDFRRNQLGSGTMNWPNRRTYQTRYRECNGVPVPRATERLRAVRGLYQDVVGAVFLVRMFRALRQRIESRWLRVVSDNRVGRPFHVRLPGGRILTEPVLRHGYYVGRLGEAGLLAGRRRSVFLEIGGGYGGLARLLRLAVPEAQLMLVDLPERLSLQAYFLSRSFPDARIVASDDAVVVSGVGGGDGPDIVLLPPWSVADLPDGSADVVINTHSMQEMRPDQMEYYLRHIERVCRGHFYCVNRYEKRIGTATVRHPRESLHGWKRVFEGPQWNQPTILEGLYQRPSTAQVA